MDPNATLKQICEHLCHKGGDYEECLELIEALIDWLSDDGFEPNDDHNFHWSDVVVGAYWFLSHYHGGEKSPEYRVLCKCGKIFRPGRTTGVEEDSSEEDVYKCLEALHSENYEKEMREVEREYS